MHVRARRTQCLNLKNYLQHLGVIDRNFKVAYTIVDEMHRQHPKVARDAFWDLIDIDIPYTTASSNYRAEPHLGSTMTMT